MAIDLSSYSPPLAFARKTSHSTPGNLDVVTLPSWARSVMIRAAGTGTVKLAHTGSQDAAVGSDYFSIPVGDSVSIPLRGTTTPLRVTGTVASDPVEFALSAAVES